MPFAPGLSGNPGGRPKGKKAVIDKCDAASEEALERLVQLMRSEDGPLAYRAATQILDRSCGRPGLARADDDQQVRLPEDFPEDPEGFVSDSSAAEAVGPAALAAWDERFVEPTGLSDEDVAAEIARFGWLRPRPDAG